MTAKTYIILSGKGGVGKTTVLANLATSLAMKGKETIVIDTDLAMSNLGLIFGLQSLPVTLHEVLAGKETIDKAIYEGPHGLKIIPSGDTISGFQEANPAGLISILDYLKQRADYLLIDTPVGLNEDTLLLMPPADQGIIIATPDLISIADALRMKVIADSMGVDIAGVVLNRADMQNPRESKEKLEKTMELNIMAVIPDDPNARKASMKQTPLVVSIPGSPASIAFKKLAADIIGNGSSTREAGAFQKLLGALGIKARSNEGQD